MAATYLVCILTAIALVLTLIAFILIYTHLPNCLSITSCMTPTSFPYCSQGDLMK